MSSTTSKTMLTTRTTRGQWQANGRTVYLRMSSQACVPMRVKDEMKLANHLIPHSGFTAGSKISISAKWSKADGVLADGVKQWLRNINCELETSTLATQELTVLNAPVFSRGYPVIKLEVELGEFDEGVTLKAGWETDFKSSIVNALGCHFIESRHSVDDFERKADLHLTSVEAMTQSYAAHGRTLPDGRKIEQQVQRRLEKAGYELTIQPTDSLALFDLYRSTLHSSSMRASLDKCCKTIQPLLGCSFVEFVTITRAQEDETMYNENLVTSSWTEPQVGAVLVTQLTRRKQHICASDENGCGMTFSKLSDWERHRWEEHGENKDRSKMLALAMWYRKGLGDQYLASYGSNLKTLWHQASCLTTMVDKSEEWIRKNDNRVLIQVPVEGSPVPEAAGMLFSLEGPVFQYALGCSAPRFETVLQIWSQFPYLPEFFPNGQGAPSQTSFQAQPFAPILPSFEFILNGPEKVDTAWKNLKRTLTQEGATVPSGLGHLLNKAKRISVNKVKRIKVKKASPNRTKKTLPESAHIPNKLPEGAVRIMQEWAAENKHWYPDPKQREDLASTTGLTPAQIKSWFANQRALKPEERRRTTGVPEEAIQIMQEWVSVNGWTLSAGQKEELASKAGLKPWTVKIWFSKNRPIPARVQPKRLTEKTIKAMQKWAETNGWEPDEEQKETLVLGTDFTPDDIENWFSEQREANARNVGSSTRLDPDAVKVMQEWAMANGWSPDSQQRADLASRTGLTPLQIRNWFEHQIRKSTASKTEESAQPKNVQPEPLPLNAVKIMQDWAAKNGWRPNVEQRKNIASMAGLKPSQVYTWFQYQFVKPENYDESLAYKTERLDPDAVKAMQEWAVANDWFPNGDWNPDMDQKLEMASKTNLTPDQIRCWFHGRRNAYKAGREPLSHLGPDSREDIAARLAPPSQSQPAMPTRRGLRKRKVVDYEEEEEEEVGYAGNDRRKRARKDAL